MRTVSLNYRQMLDAPITTELPVFLIYIDHDDLDAPIRLSSDPTTRITDDPPRYATYSTWKTDDGSPFLFAGLGVKLPEDKDDAPPQSAITFTGADAASKAALRAVEGRASVSLAVVLAGSPDVLEAEFLGMELVSATFEPDVTLTIESDALHELPWPYPRMTKDRFPALFR
ncbi:hypothetical protein [Notoacmeibacter sp. MSK16QG-6]|uniref:hypothetical protein n=1 Tax=Notoacmeibacter sp. MSK16QG-6 TaxID=2957982 RepID=UPI00209EA7C4|nr:hypothetical protein [Notoacmeibacter sp. MSK16QG-6]MCP1200048.1 hypothetical protein [Notoacmeibacter sp. MSK16QG-6]